MLEFEKFSDPKKKYNFLTTVLKRYKQFPHGVLSLAYSEQDPLWLFAENSSVVWLVWSKEKITQAKEKIEWWRFYSNSLTGFRVAGAMQLAYLFDQQIHRLTSESQWKKLFERVVKHLDPYGLFVFDFFADSVFDRLCKQWREQKITEEEVLLSSWTKSRNSYAYQSLAFVQTEWNNYTRHERSEKYFTISITQLKKLLSDVFSSVEVLDYRARKLSKKSDHAVIVCQKGRD